MSQVPPTPYQQPPTPPTPGGSYTMPPQRKTSAAAVISLVCGILGCLPFLTGLMAVIFGVVGMRATSDSRLSGRSLAVIGLVLGVLSLAAWLAFGGLFGGGIYALIQYTKPAREAAVQFHNDLAAAKTDAIFARTTGVDRDDVIKACAAAMTWGGVKEVSTPVLMRNQVNGVDTAVVEGTAKYGDVGDVPYALKLVGKGGEMKVAGFRLEPPGKPAIVGGDPPARKSGLKFDFDD